MTDTTLVATEIAYFSQEGSGDDLFVFEGDQIDFGPLQADADIRGFDGDGGDFGPVQPEVGRWVTLTEKYDHDLLRLVGENTMLTGASQIAVHALLLESMTSTYAGLIEPTRVVGDAFTTLDSSQRVDIREHGEDANIVFKGQLEHIASIVAEYINATNDVVNPPGFFKFFSESFTSTYEENPRHYYTRPKYFATHTYKGQVDPIRTQPPESLWAVSPLAVKSVQKVLDEGMWSVDNRRLQFIRQTLESMVGDDAKKGSLLPAIVTHSILVEVSLLEEVLRARTSTSILIDADRRNETREATELLNQAAALSKEFRYIITEEILSLDETSREAMKTKDYEITYALSPVMKDNLRQVSQGIQLEDAVVPHWLLPRTILPQSMAMANEPLIRKSMRTISEDAFIHSLVQHYAFHTDFTCLAKDLRILAELTPSWTNKVYAGAIHELLRAYKETDGGS